MFDAVLHVATGFMLGCGFMWLLAPTEQSGRDWHH
jgi:hypothetical protein